MDVSSIEEQFPQMKIKISAEEGKITVVEFKFPGAKRLPASYPIVISAITQNQYFQIKEPLSLTKMLMANPMMIMMMFALLVVMGMPKLLEGMSPEDLKEVCVRINKIVWISFIIDFCD